MFHQHICINRGGDWYAQLDPEGLVFYVNSVTNVESRTRPRNYGQPKPPTFLQPTLASAVASYTTPKPSTPSTKRKHAPAPWVERIEENGDLYYHNPETLEV